MEHRSSYGLCLCHTLHREKSVWPWPLWKLQLVPSVYFQGWDMAGRHDKCESAIWILLAKDCSQPLKSYLGKFFGCWFFLHYKQFLMPACEFSVETWSLDFLSKSSSSRVPWFIISWFCNSTHREQAVHSTSIVQRLFDSSVYFQCWDTARKHAGCQTGNQALLAGSLLLFCESKYVSFWNPPRGKLWVFEKTLWVLLLCSLPSILVTWLWLFWRNAALTSPY